MNRSGARFIANRMPGIRAARVKMEVLFGAADLVASHLVHGLRQLLDLTGQPALGNRGFVGSPLTCLEDKCVLVGVFHNYERLAVDGRRTALNDRRRGLQS